MITKKIFRQLIIGKLTRDIPIEEFDSEEVKKAREIAQEIIDFAEEYKLFREDLQ